MNHPYSNDYVFVSIEDLVDRSYPITLASDLLEVNGDNCKLKSTLIKLPSYKENNSSYGSIKESTIHIPIFLTQKYKDSGFFDNAIYFDFSESLSEDYNIRGSGSGIEAYETNQTFTVSGFTESRLSLVKSYNSVTPYIRNLNVADDPSSTFTGVLDLFSNKVVYVVGGDVDANGDYIQGTGIKYTYDDIEDTTVFEYKVNGITDSEFDIWAIYKRDYTLGLIEQPTVKSQIRVERNPISVFDNHLKLEEIQNIEMLEDSNYYNIL